MRSHVFITWLVSVSVWGAGGPANAQERALLCSKPPSENLLAVAKRLGNLDNPQIPYERLARDVQFFARIAPRKYTLTDKNELRDDAILGTRPVVFLTTAECIVGRNLLEIYQDIGIGYEAEDIIRFQRDQDMMAIVLLENKLGLFEHFRGTGRTHNEVLDPEGANPEAGLIEFVGPNRRIKDLPEVAIIHLGQLSIGDLFEAPSAK